MFPKLLSILIIALLSLSFVTECLAKKIKQTHKIETPKKKKDNSQPYEFKSRKVKAHQSCIIEGLNNGSSSEMIEFFADSIKFAGYDKPVSASRESFHIINRSDTDIKKVGIRLTYLDLQNRMLHSRDTEVICNVPAGETRICSIPTWDIQHTFYYFLGPEPKRVATPYKAIIELLWVEL